MISLDLTKSLEVIKAGDKSKCVNHLQDLYECFCTVKEIEMFVVPDSTNSFQMRLIIMRICSEFRTNGKSRKNYISRFFYAHPGSYRFFIICFNAFYNLKNDKSQTKSIDTNEQKWSKQFHIYSS